MNGKNIINTILTPHSYTKDNRLLKEKILTANIIMVLLSLLLFCFSIIRYIEHNYIQATADITLVVLILLCYTLLYKDKNKLLFISRILIFFATITALILIISAPEFDTRFVWISVCTYMMFFLLDFKEGRFWFVAMILILIGLYLSDIINLSAAEFIIFLLSSTILALLLSRYEKIKKESELYYHIHAKELQDAVKEKTNELLAQKNIFESLFQKSYDGILLIENNKFIECNDSIIEMLQYDKKEKLLNTHPSELSPQYQADGQLSSEKADAMMQICFEKGAHNFEWIHQKANGINFWCDVTLTHLVLVGKDIIHTVWRDISEKKALEIENKKINENLESEVIKRTQELEIAMRTKSDFLANMSHEIRTPLNAILGFIEILDKKEEDPRKKEYLKIIHTSSQGLLTIINDILDFSKLENGKLELEMHSFKALQPFEEIQLLLKEKAKEKNISCHMNTALNIPPLLIGDQIRIKQIVSNLLSNAIKFTHKNGEIIINISYNNDTSMLGYCIRDNGIGIAEDNLKNIFLSFTQADNSTTRNFGGTGLGLSISKLLVERMNGTITVTSTLDEGSEFCFYILLKQAYIQDNDYTKEDSKVENQLTLQGKVLVVEDNKTNQLLINILLDELGLDADIANNGLEAINKIKEKKYDIILMDENMPVMNGIESTIELRKMGIKTPIIAVTANALSGDRERFLDAGMDDYISKPINNNQFEAIMKSYLKKI